MKTNYKELCHKGRPNRQKIEKARKWSIVRELFSIIYPCLSYSNHFFKISVIVEQTKRIGIWICNAEWKYRISTNSFRGNYSFLKLFGQRSQYINIKIPLHKHSENRGNYSRAETIRGSTVPNYLLLYSISIENFVVSFIFIFIVIFIVFIKY